MKEEKEREIFIDDIYMEMYSNMQKQIYFQKSFLIMIFSLLLSQQVVEFFEKCLMYSIHKDKHLMTLNWNWVLVFVG
jgi:hypothetical protein